MKEPIAIDYLVKDANAYKLSLGPGSLVAKLLDAISKWVWQSVEIFIFLLGNTLCKGIDYLIPQSLS